MSDQEETPEPFLLIQRSGVSKVFILRTPPHLLTYIYLTYPVLSKISLEETPNIGLGESFEIEFSMC